MTAIDQRRVSSEVQRTIISYMRDNCFTIPQGTPEQVREHIDGQFRLLGKPFGGLILSSHDIDITTPDENIDAMVAAIKSCTY